jgi:hypothetical protein
MDLGLPPPVKAEAMARFETELDHERHTAHYIGQSKLTTKVGT